MGIRQLTFVFSIIFNICSVSHHLQETQIFLLLYYMITIIITIIIIIITTILTSLPSINFLSG